MNRGKRSVLYEEEEEEPIQIADETSPNDDTVGLCLLGKLWTARPYNMYALIETMKKLWSPSKGLVCRELGSNLISFQFNAKRDMERILDMEPWHFNKHILVLTPLASDIQPSLMKFDKTSCWVRLYDVPMRGRKTDTLHQIGQRLGKVLEMDDNTTTGIASSVRMKILLDLNNPLKRGVKIRIGTAEPCWIPVTYERLPSFCYWCGRLGHTYKDCDHYHERANTDNEITENNMPYGEWLKASPMKRSQISPQRNTEEHESIRKSLFQKQEQHKAPKADTFDGKLNERSAETQINDLLKSLEKVEVGGMQLPAATMEVGKSYTTHIHENDDTPNSLIIPTPPNHIPTSYLSTIATEPKTKEPIPSSHKPQATKDTVTPQTMHTTHPNEIITMLSTNPVPRSTLPTETAAKSIHYAPKQPLQEKSPPPSTPAPVEHHTLNTIPISDTNPTPNQPYTPIAVLREMCRLTKLPNMGIQLPKVKTEPLPPTKNSDNCQEGLKSKQSRWKRKTSIQERVNTRLVDTSIKRKNEYMEVDPVSMSDLKRTKSTHDHSSVATAAAADQPHRTL